MKAQVSYLLRSCRTAVLACTVTLVCNTSHTQTLTIRLLDAKSGRPVKNQALSLNWSPGGTGWGLLFKIGPNGIGQVDIPEGAKEIWFTESPWSDVPFADCNLPPMGHVAVEKVVKDGWVPGNACSKRKRAGVPGEIVFWAGHISWLGRRFR